MRQVYVDSTAFVALLRPHDRAHARMLAHFKDMQAKRDLLLTTDVAISDAVAQLRRDPGLERVIAFRDALARSVRGGGVRVLDTDALLRQRAFAVMAAHPTASLSYGECIAAALATSKRIAGIVGVGGALRAAGYPVEPA